MQVRSPEFKPSPTEERKERRRKGRREEGKEGERKKNHFCSVRSRLVQQNGQKKDRSTGKDDVVCGPGSKLGNITLLILTMIK
jgi:hypothetical protein